MAGYGTQPPMPGAPSGPGGAAPPQASFTCPWCGTTSMGTTISCPACGAPIDVRARVDMSGWYEMPGIKDMARIQFGQSYAQIEGTYVPVVDTTLAQSDWVYFTHHVLLWKDETVTITTMPMKGGWKRLFAGLPLIMTAAQGPGHIAFSRDAPGEMIAVPLQPGQAIDVREHVFMVATGAVAYDWFNSGVWFVTGTGDERETHYPIGMYMDRFSASQAPGLLLLHGRGNVFVRRLGQGEMVLIKPTALLYKDPSVQMQLHVEKPAGTWRSWRSWGERYLWLRLYGPGRVAVESAFDFLEDPGSTMTSSSPLSQRQW